MATLLAHKTPETPANKPSPGFMCQKWVEDPFKGAKILGFCLNVMGLAARKDDYDKDSRALHKTILAWTRKNYAWLHDYNPQIAKACLVDGMTYDAEKLRLVKTYPAEGLRREPQFDYFDLNPPLPADS